LFHVFEADSTSEWFGEIANRSAVREVFEQAKDGFTISRNGTSNTFSVFDRVPFLGNMKRSNSFENMNDTHSKYLTKMDRSRFMNGEPERHPSERN
jgi:hypothetical protein